MFRSTSFIILLSLIALCSTSTLARNENLMVVTEHMPPFQIIDSNPKHPIEGYSIEVLKATLKQAHIDYSIMPMNWDSAYRIGQSKPNTLILSMVRKAEREKEFHWLIKLSDSTASLWSYEGNNNVLNSINDITDEVIAVNRHDHHQLMLRNYANLTEKNFLFTDSKEQSIALVVKQRADYFLANNLILNWRLKSMAVSQYDLTKMLDFPQQKHELYIAASYDTSLRIRRKIQRAYDELRANGSIKTIADKWFKP